MKVYIVKNIRSEFVNSVWMKKASAKKHIKKNLDYPSAWHIIEKELMED